MNCKQISGGWTAFLIPILLSTVWFMSAYAPAWAQEPLNEEIEDCLTCHSNPDLRVTFPDGSVKLGHIGGTTYLNSVHGQQGMTCGGCHPNREQFPHPEVEVESSRAYTLKLNETCATCHPDQANLVQDSTHAEALEAGMTEAAVCVDCHGAHDVVSLHEARVRIATTCRKCHADIYDQYSDSIHGEALREEQNRDVPTCVDCHGVHNIEDPLTTEFRLNSPDLCGSCHANEALMSQYDISTNVFETYVADFHGTTVKLFEKQSPDQPTNKAVCYDCHGVHDIQAMDDPEAIAASKQNLLETCRKCHPDANANFPDSWTSHFPPTFEKQPLVATVNLFYAIFIPSVIGFMAFFVVTDAGRKFFGGGKRWHGTPPDSLRPEEDQATSDLSNSEREESNE